jgi:hypothetical protein
MTSREVVDQAFIRRVAQLLHRKRMGQPARVGLEAGRPLAFIGGQLVWIIQPMLNLIFPAEEVGNLARLLEEPEAVDQLIGLLDEE